MQSHAELEQENHQIRQILLAQEADYEAQLKSKDSAYQTALTKLKSKDRYIEQLQEALVLARNARFASNSEALRTLQLVLFDEAEQDQARSDVDAELDDAETVTIPAHKRKRGGRKPLPADLPRIEIHSRPQ